ncbi:MAG: hypothetical protein RLY93_11670 [Sumerlaeia bacterium]
MRSILCALTLSLFCAAAVAAPPPFSPELTNSPRAQVRATPAKTPSAIAAWRMENAKGASEDFSLDLNNWLLTEQPIPQFAALRLSRSNGQITMMPNADAPANSFGFVESPLVSVARSDAQGAVVGLRLTYTSPSAYVGLAPTMRVRAATEDFRIYAEAGITPNQFAQSGGRNIAIVTLDRSRLKENERLRFIVDLVSLYETDTVDPNFTVRLESAEVFVATPGGGGEAGDLISAAYMEVDGDVFALENGEDEDDRTRVRASANAYAYDASVIAVIDDGRLFAYDANKGFDGVTIEDDNNDRVIAAAVAGRYVVYVEDTGRARVYDMDSGERDTIFETGADGVSAGGDGHTVLVLDLFDSGRQASVFGYDPEDNDPEPYDVADNGDVLLLRGRQTGIVN